LDNIATPGLDVKDMFYKVGREVNAATGGRQRPEISVSMYEQYALAPAAATQTVTAPGGNTSVSEVALAWAAVQNSLSIRALDEFLQQYGNTPIYGALARDRRKELTKRQAMQPARPAPGQQTAAAAPPVKPVAPADTPCSALVTVSFPSRCRAADGRAGARAEAQ
jgi:hypothetical protein